MKKLLLILIISIFSIGNLYARTIWIFDETDNHFSMFYNAFWENLKDTKFGPYCKYVPKDKPKTDIKPDDLVIQIDGLYLETTGEAIFTYNLLMCRIGNDFSWNYKKMYLDAGTLVTQNEKAAKAAKDVLEFLEKNFKI